MSKKILFKKTFSMHTAKSVLMDEIFLMFEKKGIILEQKDRTELFESAMYSLFEIKVTVHFYEDGSYKIVEMKEGNRIFVPKKIKVKGK